MAPHSDLERSERHQDDHHLIAGILMPEQIMAIQRERTNYLLQKHLIDESSISPDGILVDPYNAQSIWLGVHQDNELSCEASGRLILPKEGIDSLQLRFTNIAQPNTEILAFLSSLPPYCIAEVASLRLTGSNSLATLHLYSEMYRVSIELGINYWLFGLRQGYDERFKKVFGPALHKIGESVHIEDAKEELTPYMIELKEGVESIRQSVKSGLENRFIAATRTMLIDLIDRKSYSSNHWPLAG